MVYKIRTGFAQQTVINAEFQKVTIAMDFADVLWEKKGFDYIEVIDEKNKLVYIVEDKVSRTPEQREERKRTAAHFARNWNGEHK